jgi:DNA-binding transcriptional LysR family regulator
VRGIEQRPVVALPWVLAVRADDPLAGQPCVSTGEFSDISLIRLPQNSTSGARLDAAFVPQVSGCPKTNWPPCRGGRPWVRGSLGGTAPA